MPEPAPAHLATVRRGTAREAVVRGHVAVVDAKGAVLAAAGDPNSVTTLRSCVKPLQALPFVRHALDEIGAGDDELALACASHSGEPVHVDTARRLLARVGLDEGALLCGPQLPFDDESATAILAAGERPGRIHNNCSGKHAAMLATCAVQGWATDRYIAPDHPLQVEIRRLISGFAGVDLDSAPVGVDGCGLPTHGLALGALARAFAAATADAGFRRCQAAMAAHPHVVAGRGRFDTALLAVAGEAITLKIGGAAVWVAVRRPSGPALAIKLEAGDPTAIPAVALAALGALGWLAPALLDDDRLAHFKAPVLRNWDGMAVGSVGTETGWTAALGG